MLLTDLDQYIFVEAGFVNPQGIWRRNIILTVNEIDKFRKDHRNTGVYTTQFRSKVEDLRSSEVYSDLYFDFDCEDNPEMAKEDAKMCLNFLVANFKVPYDVADIYFSGKKGFHIIVSGEYLGITPHKNLNQIFKLIATDIKTSFSKEKTLDTKIYDKVRMFRLAGSIHQGTGLYKIPITYDELRKLSLAQIAELAKKPRVFEKKFFTTNDESAARVRKYYEKYEKATAPRKNVEGRVLKLEKLPPCMDDLITHGVPKGNRNIAYMVLASFYKQMGTSLEDAVASVVAWNNSVLSQANPESEVERCIMQVYNNNYTYGCQTIKDIAVCKAGICSLARRK